MTEQQINESPMAGSDAPAKEELIWEGCPKWQADFNELSMAVLLALFGIVLLIFFLVKYPAGSTFGSIFKVYIELAMLLFAAGWFAWIRVKRRNQRFKISNLNLEYESGVFSKTIQNLEMWRIKDIVFHQTLGERMLGVTRVELITTDPTTPVIILEGLPPGRRVFDDIKQAFLLAKQRRNIIGYVD